MKKEMARMIVIDVVEGEPVITVSSTEACMTMILNWEETRELSSMLFNLYATHLMGKEHLS